MGLMRTGFTLLFPIVAVLAMAQFAPAQNGAVPAGKVTTPAQQAPPPDLESPRATLKTYLDAMNAVRQSTSSRVASSATCVKNGH